MTMIQLDDICFAYEGEVALRHISLQIEKGETVVLQGSNGCGKSTLLKLLNGLIFPELGTYRFEGKNITKESLKDSRFSKWFHQKVGFIFQNSDVQLFCGSVEDEIAFGPAQMGLSEEEVKKRTEDVLGLLHIEKLRQKPPYHLSGGEKKKVAIACILSMNPQVLVIDEPLAGLDKKTSEWFLAFMQELKKAGKTMIISTHNDELARAIADRIVYMDENHQIERILFDFSK